MESFPLKGFLTRYKNGKKVSTKGSILCDSYVDLTKYGKLKLDSKDLMEEKYQNEKFIKNFEFIKDIIQEALFDDVNSTSFMSQKNSLVSSIYKSFLETSNSCMIKINWINNHSTLLELMEDTKKTLISSINQNNSSENPSLANFLVDVSFFLDDCALEIVKKYRIIISLLYKLGFVRGFCKYLDFTDREAFYITLSLLDEQSFTSNNSLRFDIVSFLESNSKFLNLDHDKSLCHCLKVIETCYQTLPKEIYFNSISNLETLSINETNKETKDLINKCIKEYNKQLTLLIKQMSISLPYDRNQFLKSYQHPDIKIRRDLCFQVIKRFDSSVESSNISTITSQLRSLFKYSIIQPNLIVGRESRAFGNQAYLFANSRLIETNDEMLIEVKNLQHISSSANLKKLLNENVRNKLALTKELNDVLLELEEKIDHFLCELVPSFGRLFSLVFNETKSSALTQYNGTFQNIREALEIFERKSLSEVERKRKSIMENYYERITYNNNNNSNCNNFTFFSKVTSVLIEFGSKSGYIQTSLIKLEEIIFSLSVKGKRSVFSVLLQRPSLIGSERFKLNELETKPEQEEALQKLVRSGGDNLYMSPSYEWISEATDIIEAVPLFIFERTIINDGKPITIFEVDQEGLEQTIRQIAEFWAKNIDLTIESEHIALARSLFIKLNPELNEKSMSYAKNSNNYSQEIIDLIVLELVYDKKFSKNDLSIKIAKLAKFLAMMYDQLADEVEEQIERAWSIQNFISRIEAFEMVLVKLNKIDNYLIQESQKLKVSNEIERLSLRAFDRRKPTPAFHLLTTEAPGLVEGFITVVLEEEMAMRNVIKSFNLEEEVRFLMKNVEKNLAKLACIVISEFSYESIVNQYISNGVSKENALIRVMSDHLLLEEQVARLAIIYQIYKFEIAFVKPPNAFISLAFDNMTDDEVNIAQSYWEDQLKLDLNLIKKESLKQVYEQNKSESDFNDALKKYNLSRNIEINTTDEIYEMLLNDPIFNKEVHVTSKWSIRAKTFDFVCKKYKKLYLNERSKSFIREHTSLIQTTCRRLVISKNGLQDQLSNPRYAYTSGVVFENNFSSSAVPTGLKKRYHLIYGPSRVNLGRDERKSVENWSQFIGVSDPLAAKHAQQVYELINFSPVIRNVREAENLKVSENQWTAMIRSVRNVQAYFVERLGVGDIEDLSYQFNQRGGLSFGSLKEAEGYNCGPTAGYCIPKDLLFKLFVGTHQDSRKLLQIGIPRYLHHHLLKLFYDVLSCKSQFETVNEWEIWSVQHFLSKDALSKRFEPSVYENIQNYIENFIQLSGSKMIFHLSKFIQILGNTGVPNPLLNLNRDLHSVLWSNWSDHKLTLGGEQVNRSTVFTLTREILESAKRSRNLNQNTKIANEDSLRY